MQCEIGNQLTIFKTKTCHIEVVNSSKESETKSLRTEYMNMIGQCLANKLYNSRNSSSGEISGEMCFSYD
ncbi:hypothetical protein EB796_009367 [Bugula neritina]|uniref:Uncharacterized protein n=1 Tax=Bugula neritina TaxID=10212 RepID=A0A7J7K446_BUGNE|nr:hypothetical protein EB796_009367 [Bugula neritina]